MNASPRIVKQAKQQAIGTANRIRTALKRGVIKNWDDIERYFAIKHLDLYRTQEFNYRNVSAFCAWWENSFEERLNAEIANTAVESNKILINKDVSTFGATTLFPEQEGCYQAIFEAMFTARKIKAALQDGRTGQGKTIIAMAVVARLIKDYLLNSPDWMRLHPVMIFAPPGVPVENWKRELEKAGLGSYVRTRKIFVIPDSIFNTEHGDNYCYLDEDFVTGDASYKWNPMMIPYLIIIDECHRFVREDAIRTKKMMALIESPIEKYFIFMSATPVEKVNDARLFAVACDTSFMGIPVTRTTFNDFAHTLDATPEKPNAAAVKRLREVLAPYIFSLPYVRPKYKAINRVVLVDFLNARHKEVYNTAQVRYKEACRKAGKNTLWGRFEILVALNNFLKTAEPLRAWWIARTVAENYHSGNLASAVFACYKETISEVAFRLVDEYNIPRSKISIIWGGKREYKTEEMLSSEELERMLKDENFMMEIIKNKPLRKRVMITLKYMQDQFEHSESAEEQAYRHQKLAELKLLGKQSANQRQIEVDNFQDGTTEICLATMATGGINLSLDKNKESLKTRFGIFTPPFSGKVYIQALGRLVRRASVADAEQVTAMMKDTVEEYHVAPILDSKLQCMHEFSGRTMENIVNMLAEDIPLVSAPVHLRDKDQAIKDAEVDDTLVSENLREVDEEDEVEDLEELDSLLPKM